MNFDTDAVPGCTNVALHKFSDDPGLSFKPKSTLFAYPVLLYKNIYKYTRILCFLFKETPRFPYKRHIKVTKGFRCNFH